MNEFEFLLADWKTLHERRFNTPLDSWSRNLLPSHFNKRKNLMFTVWFESSRRCCHWVRHVRGGKLDGRFSHRVRGRSWRSPRIRNSRKKIQSKRRASVNNTYSTREHVNHVGGTEGKGDMEGPTPLIDYENLRCTQREVLGNKEWLCWEKATIHETSHQHGCRTLLRKAGQTLLHAATLCKITPKKCTERYSE